MSELEIVSEGLQKIGSVMASLESGHALKFIKAVMDRRMDLSLEDVIFKSGQNYTVSRGGRDIYNILTRDDGDFDFVKVDPRDAILKSLFASVFLTQSQIDHISQNLVDLIVVPTTSIYVKNNYIVLYNYKLHNMTSKKDNVYFTEDATGSFQLISTKEQIEIISDIDHQIKLLEISHECKQLAQKNQEESSSESEYETQKDYSDFNYQNFFNSEIKLYDYEIFALKHKINKLFNEKYGQQEQEQEQEPEQEQEFKVFEIMHVDELRKMQLHNFGLVIHEKFQVAIEQCSDSILIENKYPKHCIDWLKKECADKGYSFKQFLHGHFIEF